MSKSVHPEVKPYTYEELLNQYVTTLTRQIKASETLEADAQNKQAGLSSGSCWAHFLLLPDRVSGPLLFHADPDPGFEIFVDPYPGSKVEA